MTTSISKDKLDKARAKAYDKTFGEINLEELNGADKISNSIALKNYITELKDSLTSAESFTSLQIALGRAVVNYYENTYANLENRDEISMSGWRYFFYTEGQRNTFSDRKAKLFELVNRLKYVALKLQDKNKRDLYLHDSLILIAKQPFERGNYFVSDLKEALEKIINRIISGAIEITCSQEQIHDLEASVNGKDGIGRQLARARKELRIQGEAIRQVNAKVDLMAQMGAMSDDESDDEENKPNKSVTNVPLLNDYDGNQQNSTQNSQTKFKILALNDSMNHHQPGSSGNNGSSSKVVNNANFKSKSKK